MSKNPIDNALWHWSLKTYQDPTVAAALLALQDDGEDVLWLLYLLWCSTDESSAMALEEPSASYLEWRETLIVPVRRLRLSCDKESPVRDALLAAELAAEQQGIERLYRDHWALNSDKPVRDSVQGSGDENIQASALATAIERHAEARCQPQNSLKWQQLLQQFCF